MRDHHSIPPNLIGDQDLEGSHPSLLSPAPAGTTACAAGHLEPGEILPDLAALGSGLPQASLVEAKFCEDLSGERVPSPTLPATCWHEPLIDHEEGTVKE